MTARRLHNEYVSAVRFSPRHGWAISGGDDCGVALLRFPSLVEVGRLPTPMGVLSLDFDHSRIVAGCEDSVLRVWDADVPEDFVDFDAVANALRAAAARGRRNHAALLQQQGQAGGAGGGAAMMGGTGNGAVDPFLPPVPLGAAGLGAASGSAGDLSGGAGIASGSGQGGAGDASSSGSGFVEPPAGHAPMGRTTVYV